MDYSPGDTFSLTVSPVATYPGEFTRVTTLFTALVAGQTVVFVSLSHRGMAGSYKKRMVE